MTCRTLLCSLFGWTLLAAPFAIGDPAATAPVESLLAPSAFVSDAAGVSFRPPAGWKQTNKPGDTEIAVFSNDKNWTLRVTSAELDRPMPLVGTPGDEKTLGQPGMLDLVFTNFKKVAPDADILRNEVINIDVHAAGIVVAKYTLNGQSWLRQQAMVQSGEDRAVGAPLGRDPDKLYYVFNFITPAGSDEQSKIASDTFSALLDTIKILDRTKIKDDQNERLIRTRNLFTYWNRAKFEKIIVPKQYLRILKDGKDAGYIFCEELLDSPNLAGISAPGVIAYERTHLEEKDDKGLERHTDAGIFQYMSFDYMKSIDKAHERWTRSVVVQTQDARGHDESTYGSEFGESGGEMRRVFVPEQQGGVKDPNDEKQPLSMMIKRHTLDVTLAGKDENAEPVHRDLPPFYIPQAAWHFLPRLVVDAKAFPEPRTYLFSVYNGANREVMLLYVEKSAEQDLFFAGQRIQGVTVTERLGLTGSPIVHYLKSDGTYLGSEDKGQRLLTLVSDEKDILRRWPKANLTRPEPMSKPGAPKTPN